MLEEHLAVKVENVWKRYHLETYNRPKTLKNLIANRFQYFGNEGYYALQGVSFDIPRGRTFGIIGNNGAGKSTLLRLISRLIRPTKGRVIVRGRVGTLLELGTGFNSEFSGRENVITASILSGLTRKEAEEHVEKVIEFAELQDFIDSPVRTYSSGMFVRLAFSTEINLNPNILILDEVLAVGDIAFQKKCLDHLIKMKNDGKTLILVSHVMPQIQAVCDEVVWLEHGKVRAQGPTQEIINLYKNRLFANPKPAAQTNDNHNSTEVLSQANTPTAPTRENRTGKVEVEIESVALLNELGQPAKMLASGDAMIVLVNYHANVPVQEPNFVVAIRDENNTIVYEANSAAENLSFGQIENSGSFNLVFSSLPLLRGCYYCSVGVFEKNWDKTYDYRHNICEFQVEGNTPGKGYFLPPHRWQI